MKATLADSVHIEVPEAVLYHHVVILGRSIPELVDSGLDLGQAGAHDKRHRDRGMQQRGARQLLEAQALIVAYKPVADCLWVHRLVSF